MIDLIVLNLVVIIVTVLVVDLLDNLVISRSNRIRTVRFLIEDVVEIDVEVVLVFELVLVLENESIANTLALGIDFQARTQSSA